MKKLLSILVAAMMLFALALPVFAENQNLVDLFGFNFDLLKNEPVVEEDEYGDEYNVWEVLSQPDYAIGDTITFMLSYSVPNGIEGFTDEALASIVVALEVAGISDLSIVEAFGCDPNYQCDYDLGICNIMPGYGNVSIEGSSCVISNKLNRNVKVVFTGKVDAATVAADIELTIGQSRFPAIFSVGTVVKYTANGTSAYNVSRTILNPVEKRSMEFRYCNDADCLLCEGDDMHHYVGLNGHYYLCAIEEGDIFFFPVDADFNSDPSGEMYIGFPGDDFGMRLLGIYDEFMGFFNITADEVVDDQSFLGGINTEVVSFTETLYSDDGSTPAPNPNPPETGFVSIAALGIIALIGGAVTVASSKKD